MDLHSAHICNIFKQKKQGAAKQTTGLDGSYIEIGSNKIVGAATSNMGTLAETLEAPDNNQTILMVLSRLEAANQDLAKRMDRIEQQSNTNFTPLPLPRPREI